MTLSERLSYLVICDACGRTFSGFPGERFEPQEVLALVGCKYGWFIDDDIAYCADCPHPSDEEDTDGAG